MPSHPEGPSGPSLPPRDAAAGPLGAGAALQLVQATRALWSANLALMTAFMQTPAPAHRLLLARRIARNFDTLAQQEECFDSGCRTRFARLGRRWQARADQLAADQGQPAPRRGLPRLLS